MSRMIWLGVGLSTVVGLAVLVLFISSEKRQARNKQLQENLRLAGLKEEVALVASGPPPKIVLPEHQFDFGRVSPQASVSHRFEIRNEGEGTLRIKVAERSCTCVVGTLEKDTLVPGESTYLELSLRNEGKEAQVAQGARLETNDPEQKFVDIRLVGDLRRELWAESSVVDFTGLLPGEVRTKHICLYSKWPEGFEIHNIIPHPSQLKVETMPLSSEEVESQQAASGVELSITCPAEVHDFFAGSLSINVRRNGTKHDEDYFFEVHGERLGLIGILGTSIDELGEIKAGNVEYGVGRTLTFSMVARGKEKQLVVKKVQATPAFVEVAIKPSANFAESGLHTLTINIPPNSPEGSFQGKSAGKIEIEFEGEYPKLVFKLEFAVVNDGKLTE